MTARRLNGKTDGNILKRFRLTYRCPVLLTDQAHMIHASSPEEAHEQAREFLGYSRSFQLEEVTTEGDSPTGTT